MAAAEDTAAAVAAENAADTAEAAATTVAADAAVIKRNKHPFGSPYIVPVIWISRKEKCTQPR